VMQQSHVQGFRSHSSKESFQSSLNESIPWIESFINFNTLKNQKIFLTKELISIDEESPISIFLWNAQTNVVISTKKKRKKQQNSLLLTNADTSNFEESIPSEHPRCIWINLKSVIRKLVI
jgi:hypothetical protein